MEKKRDSKIHALVPENAENASTLEKLLSEYGISVKKYGDLVRVKSMADSLDDIVSEDGVLLFCDVHPDPNLGLLPSASAMNAEPMSDPQNDLGLTEVGMTPHQKIKFANVMHALLKEILSQRGRIEVGLVYRLPRDSDWVNSVPPAAHYLPNPSNESEMHFFMRKWIADVKRKQEETRQRIEETIKAGDVAQGESGEMLESLEIQTEADGPKPQSQSESDGYRMEKREFSPPNFAIKTTVREAGNVVRSALKAFSGLGQPIKPQNSQLEEKVGANPIQFLPVESMDGTSQAAQAPVQPENTPIEKPIRVSERQQALRLEDREQVIQILVRYLMPLDLSQYSQPKGGFDPKAKTLFENGEVNHEIVSTSDWTTSRGLHKSAEVLGIESLITLQSIAQKAARQHIAKKYEPVTVHLGPGDGEIMSEFAEEEILQGNRNRKPTKHVGVARSLLFPLSDMLNRSMVPGLDEGKKEALMQFNQRITHLFQREFGRFGRLKINLNLPEDQIRLRDYLIRLAKNPEALRYAQGNPETLSTTGKYADDKPDLLSKEEMGCFTELCADPVAFFKRYYSAYFDCDSKQGTEELLGTTGKRDILYGDFKDMPSLLGNTGPFVTFAYSVKGFSHLEDYDYGVAMNEVAARLVPGGILIDDGVVESYTWHHRIWQLRELQKNLGGDSKYRIYLIGNDQGPMSAVLQRGVPIGKSDQCVFSLSEIINNCPDSKVVNLKNYEKVWPMAALGNKITKRIKDQLLHGLVRGIVNNTLRLECAQTWRQACLKEIDPLFNSIFEQYVAELKAKKASKAGKTKKKDLLKLSNDKHVDAIMNRFEKERGESLETFIKRLLLKLYHEKKEEPTPKKGE